MEGEYQKAPTDYFLPLTNPQIPSVNRPKVALGSGIDLVEDSSAFSSSSTRCSWILKHLGIIAIALFSYQLSKNGVAGASVPAISPIPYLSGMIYIRRGKRKFGCAI